MTGIEWEGSDKAASGVWAERAGGEKASVCGRKDAFAIDGSADLCTLAAGGISVFLGERGDAVIIAAVVLLNATVGVIQEERPRKRWSH